MIGFPNQRSIHAGGILISEKPITCFTALDLPPKGFATTQWDMYVAEELGFEKLDILSQRGIGHIKEAVELVFKNRGITIDIHQVEKFKTDPKVRQQLRNAETNGCFYIESPAMRGLLKKLHCSNYLTLVAASSIIRPGVARSGMMREYIHRFHHPNDFKYIHPVMKEQLEETFGVMVYQEDVLKVCHHFAGLDLADADVLRRAMSGKFRSRTEFQKIVDKFFFNCKARGYPEEITKEVWRQIESFAGYSFSKAHSASYAVESFQSLYLKAYFPLEFQVAVINNFGGFYHAWVYFNELVRQGGKLHLPCINHSDYLTNIHGDVVYMGFVHVQKLEQKLANLIVDERDRNGPYQSMEDFIRRVQPGREQMVILIRMGALRFTHKEKAQLLWEAYSLMARKSPPRESRELFAVSSRKFELPGLVHSPIEDAYDEIELIGFPVTVNAFDRLQTSFRGEIMARQMDDNLGKQVRMLGRLVTIKYVKTVKNEMMHFATFLDYEGEFFDSVHFPDSLKRYPFQGYGIYLMQGKVVEEFGYTTLEVQKLARLPVKGDPREG
jgi:DNA polymerase III alpha subunit